MRAGSFGEAWLRILRERYDTHAGRIFSRDELKRSELQAR
jgi:hypothetical protein